MDNEKVKLSMKEGEDASGSFGTVKRQGDTIVKKSNLLEGIFNKNLNTWNLNEIFFLKTNQASFVPAIQNIKITKDMTIEITENYLGKVTNEWALENSPEKVTELFPDFLCQIARILCWLKSLHVVHGDIKFDNVTIDEKNNIGLIDFGSVTLVYPNNYENFDNRYPYYIDPRFFHYNNIPITYDYDMFSMGFVLLGLLFLEIPSNTSDKIFEKWVDEKIYTNDIADFYSKKLKEEIDKIPKEIKDIILKMINPDIEKRIKAEELYNLPYLDNVRSKYPLIDIEYSKEEEFIKQKIEIFDSNYIDSIINISKNVILKNDEKMSIIINLTLYILYRYALSYKLVDDMDILGCFNLALIISRAEYTYLKYTGEIWKSSLEIAASIDWEIYPRIEITEFDYVPKSTWKKLGEYIFS